MSLNRKLLSAVTDAILLAGSDQVDGFQGLYEGGYHIQQVPNELARLASLLSAFSPFSNYLEIGTAAGGTLRFLTEQVQIDRTVVIDNGAHPKFKIWTDQNRKCITNLTEFIGDSHSTEAKDFLQNLNTTFDLVGIDGDHSAQGVKADWDLIQPYISQGSLVWFHDIVCIDGVKSLWTQLKDRHTPILETKELGIGVIRIR